MALRSGGSHVEGPADVLTRQTGIHCPPPAVGPVTHQSAISPLPGEDGSGLDGFFRVLIHWSIQPFWYLPVNPYKY